MNRELLEKPFDPEQIKQREGSFGKMLDYIEGHSVIQRLNDSFNTEWSFEILEHKVFSETDEVIVLGNSFLRNDARSRMRSFRQRGKPLDNGKKREFVVYRYDNDDKNYENLFAEIFRNRRSPLDHQVLEKMDFEKFLNSLSAAERIIVRCKLEGWFDLKVKKKLRVCWSNYYALKRGIRPKIFEFYNV
jgi:hypothetical protein